MNAEKAVKLQQIIGPEKYYIWLTLAVSLTSSSLEILGMMALPSFLTLTLFPEVDIATLPRVGIANWAIDLNIFSIFILMIFLFSTRGVLAVTSDYITVRLSQRIRKTVGQRLSKQYLQCELELILNRPLSEIITMTNSYCDIFSNQVVLPLLNIFTSSVIAIVIITFLGYIDTSAVLIIVFILCIIGALFQRIFKRSTTKFADDIKLYNADYQRQVAYAFRGPREVRLLQLQEKSLAKMRYALNKLAGARSGIAAIQNIPRACAELVAIFLALGYLIYKGNTDGSSAEIVAHLAIFAFGGLRLIACFSQIMGNITVFRSGSKIIDTLADELAETANTVHSIVAKEAENPSIGQKSDWHFLSLNIEHLSFSYQHSKEKILNELTFSLRAGESVGIIGSSGAGKSTFADVLIGLLRPASNAEMLINGNPGELMSPQWWDLVGFVPQVPFIANDSLVNNIAFGLDRDKIEFDRVHDVIRLAQLEPVVASLPEGIDTQVGDLGARLSGGQRQRVAIARALYFEREILVFDEATSSLDTETEAEIVAAIESLRHKLTTVVIAHRLSTLKPCDRVLKLENGKLHEVSLEL